MKRILTVVFTLVLGLGVMSAQEKQCCRTSGGDCAVKRTEKISRFCTKVALTPEQKAQVLSLNQDRARNCHCGADLKAMDKGERKSVKAADKVYVKSLKSIVGKKNYRQVRAMDKVERRAIAASEKQEAKAARKQ